MAGISLSSSSRQSLFKIIADTPFLSSPITMIGLPGKLKAMGLSSLSDVAGASQRKLASGVSLVEVRIENGTYGGKKSHTLQSLDGDLPARFAALLQEKAKGAGKRTALNVTSLDALL